MRRHKPLRMQRSRTLSDLFAPAAGFLPLPALIGMLAVLGGCSPAGERPPNVVIILADDLGYSDVGVYGARGFETPNIDRLAAEGIRFTSMYVENVCSPTRAALMTGSYAVRAGVPRVLFPRTTTGINPDETTIAEVLKDTGYATAAIGKWHLGDHPVFLPTNHGFDHYFGIPYSNDMSPDSANNPRPHAANHPPLPLIRDTIVVEREPDQSQLTQRYTAEAVRFIDEHASRPFFLYMAHTFPHVPLYASDEFRGTTERGLFGDVVSELDWSVGRVLETLERNGLTENTLVVFLSDNGPWLVMGEHGGSARPLREGKATTFEGGHRVPAVVRWPGTIPGGITSDAIVAVMDLLPTAAAAAGSDSIPANRIDGYNLMPMLKDGGADSPRETFFYYLADDLQAVRVGRWKLHLPHSYLVVDVPGVGGHPGRYARREIGVALFDLESDASETENVAEEHPDVVQELMAVADSVRHSLGDADAGIAGAKVREPGTVEAPWSEQTREIRPGQ